jgi:hypothetical protein
MSIGLFTEWGKTASEMPRLPSKHTGHCSIVSNCYRANASTICAHLRKGHTDLNIYNVGRLRQSSALAADLERVAIPDLPRRKGAAHTWHLQIHDSPESILLSFPSTRLYHCRPGLFGSLASQVRATTVSNVHSLGHLRRRSSCVAPVPSIDIRIFTIYGTGIALIEVRCRSQNFDSVPDDWRWPARAQGRGLPRWRLCRPKIARDFS